MLYYCKHCGRDFPELRFCFDCRFCKADCICTRPKFFNSKLEFHTPSRGQKKINKSARYISAEIEVAGIKKGKKIIGDVVAKWKGSIVYDGTLPHRGFEINTSPAAGDLYIRQITDICEKLDVAEAETSSQCGLHVHLDARDYNYCDLYRLVKVYAAIEPALFGMVSSSRHNSAYAMKCADKLEKAFKGDKLSHIQLKERLCNAVYGQADSSLRNDKRGAGPGTGRYYALNLHSWFHRGTIECRLFDGTLDKNEIINWGVLWANILDFTLHSSDDELSVVMDKKKSLDSLLYIVKDNAELVAFISKRYEQSANKKSYSKNELSHILDIWAQYNP